MDLFDRQALSRAPLAERVRPRRLSEVVGQRALLRDGALFSRLVRADRLPSMILYGPPGTGKTTLAQVLANETSATFVPFSAVLGGVPHLRSLLNEARERRAMGGATLLFVDEIHRFNKAQQDALLPHVEKGIVTLVGATTENPSFAVNSALLSRARVFRLESLSEEELAELLKRAIEHPDGVEKSASEEVLLHIARAADGDARSALGLLEALSADGREINEARVAEAAETLRLRYDKNGDEHFAIASALIKSMRGSDPDAAIYWMMRMVDGGEDPLFITRRLVIFASEDIGNADPRSLQLAVAADAAVQRLGMPEGLFAMAQCCVYLATAPKSNASYRAFQLARDAIKKFGSLPVPPKLRNARSRVDREAGFGKGYRYPHNEGGFAAGETYLPDPLTNARFYHPTHQGFEARMSERLATLWRERHASEEE